MPAVLTIRLPDEELAILAAYAAQTGRTQTDIVRENIRALAKLLKRKRTK